MLFKFFDEIYFLPRIKILNLVEFNLFIELAINMELLIFNDINQIIYPHKMVILLVQSYFCLIFFNCYPISGGSNIHYYFVIFSLIFIVLIIIFTLILELVLLNFFFFLLNLPYSFVPS